LRNWIVIHFRATPIRILEPRDDPYLTEFAGTAASRRLEGLAADGELLDVLLRQGYRGRDWIVFSRALAEYGYQVIFAWCLSGKILIECARKGFGVARKPPRPIDRDDASELAAETVAASLVYFRDRVLVPRIWEPARGASLKTFFVGACVLMFANVYRQWRLENAPLVFKEGDPDLSSTIPASAAFACDLHRLLGGVGVRDRDLLKLAALGFTQVEMAELLGTTRKAVERRLERLRNRLRTFA
jgi:DNA-directed RNA polymerase specialized sigma24 family protein